MSSDSSNSSGEGGNNRPPLPNKKKQISPAKRWCFTFNNYTDADISSIVPDITRLCDYAIIGAEVGESGTPHLQGYVEFKTKVRPLSCGFPSMNWEKCKGNRASNTAYCSKDGKVIFSLGLPKPINIIDTLKDWQKDIENIMMTEPDDRTIYWYWENKGNVGKTSFMKYAVVKHKAIPCIGGRFGDVCNMIFNADMDKSNTVLFNIPRGGDVSVSYSALEAIKDGMIVNNKYETGFKVFNSPHVIVFANFPPRRSMLSADRWKVVEIT